MTFAHEGMDGIIWERHLRLILGREAAMTASTLCESWTLLRKKRGYLRSGRQRSILVN